MRLLADENVPRGLVDALRARGHDVAWVVEDDRGATDERIVRRALAEARVLLAFDNDVAARARAGRRRSSILVRRRASSPEGTVESLVAILDARDDWAAAISVIDGAVVRRRALRRTRAR